MASSGERCIWSKRKQFHENCEKRISLCYFLCYFLFKTIPIRHKGCELSNSMVISKLSKNSIFTPKNRHWEIILFKKNGTQLVKSYGTFSVFTFGPLVAKLIIESGRNLVSRLNLPRGIYVASFRSIAQVDTKSATFLYNRHFLCNLTSVTLKSRSNQKLGGYHVYPY